MIRLVIAVLFVGFATFQASSASASSAKWKYGRATNQDGSPVSYAVVDTTVGNVVTNVISAATLGFTCTRGKVQFNIAADRVNFGSYGRVFKFSYSAGGSSSPARVVVMEVKDGAGYTVEYAKPVALTMLGQNYLVAGALDVNGNAVAMKISLRGSDKAIKRVYADCGQSLR